MDASSQSPPPAAGTFAGERARAFAFLARRERFHPAEALPWLLAIAAFFLFPNQMTLGSQTLIMVLFALSLDLILGYAGIVTLGHAAYFGVGAYAAALLITSVGWTEPISGLVCATIVAAIAGLFSGLVSAALSGPRAAGADAVYHHHASAARQSVSRFHRRLRRHSGHHIAPLFGYFDYDLYGHTNYLYCLGVLLVVFLGVRRIVNSPFGQALVGIRENVGRMHALGSPVHWRLVTAYTISAGLAGTAGALFAQTNTLVTLGVFDFDQSAAVLMMLILGGAGWLYGGFVGAVLYMVLQNELAKLSPAFWQFGIGLILVVVVLLTRRGVFAKIAAFGRRLPFGAAQ